MVAGLVSGRWDTREICNRAVERGELHRSFIDDICNHFHTVTGIELPDSPGDLARELQASSIDHYLTFLEVAMNDLWDFRRHKEDLDVLQSILADDASVFRFRESPSGAPRFTIIEIDNPHLKREIIDRTLELTANLEMQAAQADYEDAWKAYARGDFAHALVSAGKAYESAAKAIIKRVDPNSRPEEKTVRALSEDLRRLQILPDRQGLDQFAGVFQNAGALRNAPGAAHGSVDLTSPDANVALLGLHLSGSLVFFLAKSWESRLGAEE